jgi:hypothetical protein
MAWKVVVANIFSSVYYTKIYVPNCNEVALALV